MSLNYITNNQTYNLTGTYAEDKKYRLHYIASGSEHQLGLARNDITYTDTNNGNSTYRVQKASLDTDSPMIFKIGDQYYKVGKTESIETSEVTLTSRQLYRTETYTDSIFGTSEFNLTTVDRSYACTTTTTVSNNRSSLESYDDLDNVSFFTNACNNIDGLFFNIEVTKFNNFITNTSIYDDIHIAYNAEVSKYLLVFGNWLIYGPYVSSLSFQMHNMEDNIELNKKVLYRFATTTGLLQDTAYAYLTVTNTSSYYYSTNSTNTIDLYNVTQTTSRSSTYTPGITGTIFANVTTITKGGRTFSYTNTSSSYSYNDSTIVDSNMIRFTYNSDEKFNISKLYNSTGSYRHSMIINDTTIIFTLTINDFEKQITQTFQSSFLNTVSNTSYTCTVYNDLMMSVKLSSYSTKFYTSTRSERISMTYTMSITSNTYTTSNYITNNFK